MVGSKTVGTFVGVAAAGGRPTLDQEKSCDHSALLSAQDGTCRHLNLYRGPQEIMFPLWESPLALSCLLYHYSSAVGRLHAQAVLYRETPPQLAQPFT